METNRWPASASMINQDDHKGAKDCQNSLEESEIMLNSPDSPSSSASGYIGEETFDQSTRIVCTLCYCEIHSHMIHTIESCGCRFCVTCLRTYLILNIKENNINGLVCPDPNCVTLKKPKRSISDRLLFRGSAHSKNRKQSKDLNGSVIRALTNGSSGSNGAKFTPQEIKLLVGNEMYSLYKKYKLIMDVDEDPNRTWCPKANCDTICLITKPSVGRLPASAAFSIKLTKSAKVSLTDGRSSFYCAKCNEVYCTTCRKKWHDKPLCKSSSEVELSAASDSRANGLDGSDVDSNIKRCPRCLVWIERDEGCAQMMCRKCKHVFCWFCLHSLEDDFFLRHYDKGPCKNRLGHSRPSVLWHRTQVIAIFAGLGLLLLLASPLFLIASPCILCCNSFCGSNCKYVEEKEGKEEEDNGFEFPPYP